MTAWLRNLGLALDQYPIVVLHGNVRDAFLDSPGSVHGELASLLESVLAERGFERLTLYGGDVQVIERDLTAEAAAPRNSNVPAPEDAVARLCHDLGQPERRAALFTNFDLALGDSRSASPPERRLLVRILELPQTIASGNRLILVVDDPTRLPSSLRGNNPHVAVVGVPLPNRDERAALARLRLGDRPSAAEAADMTDGLSAVKVQAAMRDAAEAGDPTGPQLRALVNRHKIGEREDHWAELSVDKLNNSGRWFKEVQGQDEAVRRVVDALYVAREDLSGLASGYRSRPRAVLFFAGPSGVGKTLLAKRLAHFLFGAEESRLIRLDMSEYKEPHTIAKLFGAPPGYVGFDQGGRLTGAVQENPFSVVLFDEVEKANPQVMDVFLQILDDGRLTDSRGTTVYFTETVVIFTSNIGHRNESERTELDAILRDSPGEDRRRRIADHFQKHVARFFAEELSRPELLNRLGGNVVTFNPLEDEGARRKIVEGHLERIRQEFAARYRAEGYTIQVSAPVVEELARTKESEARFGARGLANDIHQTLVVPLARQVARARGRGQEGVTFLVEQDGDGVTVKPSRVAREAT